MDMIMEAIVQWFREILVGGIVSNLTGMFDRVNQQVGDVATQVGMTPQAWNGSIHNMIQSLSETVIVPIAGMILAVVMTVELIQMVADRNSMHDSVFYKRGFSNASNTTNGGQLICGRMT